MRLETWAARWWRGDAGALGAAASAITWPLELAFRTIARGRGLGYDRGLLPVRSAPVPVLSIGNLTVGGTGKTPIAAWWAARLVEAGLRPALVARGYGRDELLLHERWNPDVPVIAAVDRLAAARSAAEQGADFAVLDDGFQHRRLARDADVVLVAAETSFPGRLLPRGPYREGPGGLSRADLVVVTRKAAPEAAAVLLGERIERFAPGIPVARALLAPAGWRGLDGSPADPPEGPVLVATAVADAASVATTVRAALAHATGPGRPVAAPPLEAFPDHHEFDDADVARLTSAAAGRTLVVTEKDAVKLRDHEAALPAVRVLALEVRWEAGEDAVEGLVRRMVTLARGASR